MKDIKGLYHLSDEASKISYNNTGTTLVELLISIVILAFVIGIFLSVFQYSNRTNIDTHELVDGLMWFRPDGKIICYVLIFFCNGYLYIKRSGNSDGSFSVTVSGPIILLKRNRWILL